MLSAKFKSYVVERLLSYQATELASTIRKKGVRSGDVLMVHASWMLNSGFKGRPIDMVNALKAVVGPDGLLIMTSLTYQNETSKEFLIKGEPMNVRRSPSRMGLLTEVFRRGKDTRRSLSPTHSVLAWGKRADEFVEGHEHALVPFGKGSPFEKFFQLKGKILAIDAPFSVITFTHFVEDQISNRLPFDLYDPEIMIGEAINYSGNRVSIPVRVLSLTANCLRREERLVCALEKEGILKTHKIGNTRLLLVDAQAMTACAERLTDSGKGFFNSP